ncbi:MAG TPA: hypothetical protein VGM80_15460 [Gaiellaceae bacterium]|jgi:hypothetical protein
MRVHGAALLAAVLALGLVAGAGANKNKLNKADIAAARANLLKLSDLPPPFTWKSGKVQAGVSPPPLSCKGFRPKTSDLVTTGHADVVFTAQGVQLEDQSELLQSTKMVQNDFKRTFVAALLPCLKETFTRGATGLAVLRVGQISFPHVATYTAAYRILFKLTAKGKPSEEGAFDLIALGAGRKEVSLAFSAILGSAANEKSGLGGMAVIEQKLSAVLAKRALGMHAVA